MIFLNFLIFDTVLSAKNGMKNEWNSGRSDIVRNRTERPIFAKYQLFRVLSVLDAFNLSFLLEVIDFWYQN